MGQQRENQPPVLNAVVESGNESIIQSSRLGREVLRELEALRQSTHGTPTDPLSISDDVLDADHDLGDGTERWLRPADLDRSSVEIDASDLNSANESGDTLHTLSDNTAAADGDDNSPTSHAWSSDDEDDIELMIDDLVDRHIIELRKDIRRLLERAQLKP